MIVEVKNAARDKFNCISIYKCHYSHEMRVIVRIENNVVEKYVGFFR